MLRKRSVLWAAYALLIAFAILFFASKSSFAYPINDWADANIYLTIGKGMTQGQVVYRDLYDHKGPLLYGLHALCALISFSDFTGVFVMEVLFAAAFLHQLYRIMRLYGAERAAWVLLPLTALLIYTSPSFAEGDSAEEMCLPLAAATLYGVLAYLRGDEKRMSAGSLVLHGALTGCVFWIKFTMIGLHAGLLGWVLLRHLIRREWKALMASIGWLIAGFGLSTIPWVVYFGLNGAIVDWLKVYLYDNLFLYGGGGGSIKLKAMVKCGLDWFVSNLRYTLPMLAGLVWYAVRCPRERMAVWLMAALGAAATFIGGKSYPYYGLVLAVLVIPFMASIGPEIRLGRAACAVCAAVCVALCPLMSQNVRPTEGVAFGQPREESMQYRFAAHINETEDATLLNYGFMDAGFYTAAGLVPQVKYFHQTNVPLQEMLDEQIRYIEEGLSDYVITRGKQPDSIHDHYELIAEEPSPNFWYEKVYLYRKKGI